MAYLCVSMDECNYPLIYSNDRITTHTFPYFAFLFSQQYAYEIILL